MDPDKDRSLEEKLDRIQQRFKKSKIRVWIPADNAKWLMKAGKALFDPTPQKAAIPFRKQKVANTLFKQGKLEEALDFASHLDPVNRANFLRTMAIWYTSQHDLSQALKIAEMILDTEIRDYAQCNIVHILSLQNQFQKAKAIALSIADRGYREDAILDIVKAYLQDRRVDEAIQFVDSLQNPDEKSNPAKVIAAFLKVHHQDEKVSEVRKIFSLFPAPIRMAA